MAERKDPLRNFRFRLTIDGITAAGFSECTIPDVTVDVVDYRNGNDPTFMRKLSGLTKYGNVTLKTGVTADTSLYKWHNDVVSKGAKDNRKSLSIVMVDEAGDDQAQWDLVDAWPTKYDPSDLSSKGNEVLIESIELVHEGITRTK